MDVFHAVVSVFAVPRPTNGRFCAHDWDLRHPLFHCAIWINPDEGPADLLRVRLQTVDGSLIAVAPYDGANGISSVTDSARHYVLVVSNGSIDAQLGIGFPDPADSIDFSLAIQRFMQRRLTIDRLQSARWRDRLVAKMEDSQAQKLKGRRRRNSSPPDSPEPEAIATETIQETPAVPVLAGPNADRNRRLDPGPVRLPLSPAVLDTPPDNEDYEETSDEFGEFQ